MKLLPMAGVVIGLVRTTPRNTGVHLVKAQRAYRGATAEPMFGA